MRTYRPNAWRGSAFCADWECTALAWTEALNRAPDEDHEMFTAQFSKAGQADFVAKIRAIDLWNQRQVGLRAVHPLDAPR